MLVNGLATWPVFDDVPEALRRLKTRFKLALVTNCDRDLLPEVESRLGVPFDAIVTSEHVAAYKPSPKLFEELLKRLGIQKDALVHVAQSLFHDVEPASVLGIATVHVDRRKGRPGGATPKATTNVMPDLRVQSLADLVAQVPL